MRSGEKWTFETARFRVVFSIERERGFKYDGEDEGGEIQAALDSGEMVAFSSAVEVFFEDEESAIGSDYLGGSVYTDGTESEFWTAHRGADPMNRNCSIMRAANGERVSIGHYFPDMVRQAIAEARRELARRHVLAGRLPRVRGLDALKGVAECQV